MCGIVGIVDKKKQVVKELLLRMSDSLIHRGPNDSGIFINADMSIGLGHRRLSIIDLSSLGRQPMSDQSEKVWITFNGEIYNFPEIKDELRGKGYKFQSETDTEVIINAYKEWGIDCIKKFNGMFAFGIYDIEKRAIHLVRDRIGKKPLYYSYFNGRLLFASELKAILCDACFPTEVDYEALNYYLTFGYIPFDYTIYKYARKLPPAHLLTFDLRNDNLRIIPYWEMPSPDSWNYQEDELLEELECLLEDAVRIRLKSDVPFGAFLSGGIDSSLIVAFMAKLSSAPIKTFSIGFEEKGYSELLYAKIVARHFNTQHTELVVKPDALGILKELVEHFDEPFADSSMIPTSYVSKLTRVAVTVGLSGDGGDELFGGYSSYLGTLGNKQIAKIIPSFIRENISRCSELLSEKFVWKRQLLRLRYDPYMTFVDRMSHDFFKKRYRKRILSPDVTRILGQKYDEPERVFFDRLVNINFDFLNKLEALDLQTYLPEDICTKVDRTSMKSSLEVRCPLLDYRIVEFAFKKVPGRLKIKGLRKKYLLYKLGKKILPPALDLQRKQGFNPPIKEWFRGNLPEVIAKLLLTNCESKLLNKIYIKQLLNEHQAGINHSGRLYAILVLLLWERKNLKDN